MANLTLCYDSLVSSNILLIPCRAPSKVPYFSAKSTISCAILKQLGCLSIAYANKAKNSALSLSGRSLKAFSFHWLVGVIVIFFNLVTVFYRYIVPTSINSLYYPHLRCLTIPPNALTHVANL